MNKSQNRVFLSTFSQPYFPLAPLDPFMYSVHTEMTNFPNLSQTSTCEILNLINLEAEGSTPFRDASPYGQILGSTPPGVCSIAVCG